MSFITLRCISQYNNPTEIFSHYNFKLDSRYKLIQVHLSIILNI